MKVHIKEEDDKTENYLDSEESFSLVTVCNRLNDSLLYVLGNGKVQDYEENHLGQHEEEEDHIDNVKHDLITLYLSVEE